MDAVIKVEEVEKHETRNGNTRYVVRDEADHEYVTFRPQIGKDAETYKGQTAHIRFHEEQRGGFKNIYLDAIEPLEQPGADEGGADIDPDIVGWQTAAEVAPLIAGNAGSPDEVFDEMKRFKERVAADIRGDKSGRDGGD
jgi:hypothetical protein